MQTVCAARRHNMRRALILLLLTLSCAAATAQEEADDFYLYKLEGQEASVQRRIETDTMLFYRAMQSGGDLFGRITEYSFFHVDYARRGIYYADRPALIDGIEMRRANISVIRRLGVSEYGYAGLAGGAVEKGVNAQTGLEYIVKLDNGQVLSVTQGTEQALGVGQRCLVLFGSTTRIIAQ